MKPLTIEQLKSLEVGDWVWITQDKRGCYAEIQYKDENGLNVARGKFCYWMNYSDYGKNWIAYKNKEQAEAKGIIVEAVEQDGFTPYIAPEANTGHPMLVIPMSSWNQSKQLIEQGIREEDACLLLE